MRILSALSSELSSLGEYDEDAPVLVSRFAPSPTGRLHLGHALSARLAWDLARSTGGQFLLRFEDIDHTRVRPEFYQGIEDDLRWLGLNWDQEPLRQLSRLPTYEEALCKLQKLGVVYPCFCTRRELALSAPQEGDAPALYTGTCRNLSKEQRAERLATEDHHAWRLDSQKASDLTGPLQFHDHLQGNVHVNPNLLGDVVIARKDIATSYHIAVVIDDAFQSVTNVIRGEDLLLSTHVHRLLQILLELPPVNYYHHHLVTDELGKRLAKRHDALSLERLREQGMTPQDIWHKLDLA